MDFLAPDLVEYREEQGHAKVAIARVDQLYPFPRRAIAAEIERIGATEIVWCQEEPKNMGAWTTMLSRLADMKVTATYAGRAASPSPATGSYKRHTAEQENLVARAFA